MADLIDIRTLDLPPAWHAQAVCGVASGDAEFFPEKGGASRSHAAQAAKTTCQGCPVKQQCLDYALEHRVAFGIWGGLSAMERRQLISERRKAS